MVAYVGGNRTAIIVLHEIYGINNFMMDICQQYHAEGYDVYCPDLFHAEKAFPYAKAEEAYHTFMDTVGFDAYREINKLASGLKAAYSKVMIIGLSVGATIAWRCSEQILYDGIICCYGSRIRDYLTVTPRCPVLLVFAKYDSFDVAVNRIPLESKFNTAIEIVEASHGFVDPYSQSYSHPAAERFNQLRKAFLTHCANAHDQAVKN